MESKREVFASVKSPSKSSNWRRAKGFSLEEINQSGKDLTQLKELKIDIDYFRKSFYQENIEALKALKIEGKDEKKRNPFVQKEKKRTPFKPSKEKAKTKPKKVITKTPVIIKEPLTTKKEKGKSTKAGKAKVDQKGTPLTDLPGLGAATAKKFLELGINSVEELCDENPEEIAPLIKGVSLDRCRNWIEDGKQIIN